VHVACTEFLTAMHTGGRSANDIDAGAVLPGYHGTIVRDGYAGYDHLGDAVHAWCGAHGLRDLKGLYQFDPRYEPEITGIMPRCRTDPDRYVPSWHRTAEPTGRGPGVSRIRL
jgi:Transposase IS66 family